MSSVCKARSLDAEARYESLCIPDIQAAWQCPVAGLRVQRGWRLVYVSAGKSPPALAHDMGRNRGGPHSDCAWPWIANNLLIKVPATPAGVCAFEQLTAAGVRVNVTLIFSLAQYEAVAQAYLRGALRWLEGGGSARQLRSVASMFLSRVDTHVDKRLDAIGTTQAHALKGRTGVALAKRCYHR